MKSVKNNSKIRTTYDKPKKLSLKNAQFLRNLECKGLFQVGYFTNLIRTKVVLIYHESAGKSKNNYDKSKKSCSYKNKMSVLIFDFLMENFLTVISVDIPFVFSRDHYRKRDFMQVSSQKFTKNGSYRLPDQFSEGCTA